MSKKILEDLLYEIEQIEPKNDLEEEYKENALNAIKEWRFDLYESEQ